MEKYKKKIIINIAVVVLAIIFMLIVIQHPINDILSIILPLLILAVAGWFIYWFNYKYNDDLLSGNEKESSDEEPTEKDLLWQIANDIHIIKIIVIAFAAAAVVMMLISLFSIASLAETFSKLSRLR